MYIGMNRFKVLKERAADFEQVWLTRESYLHELDGFIEFHMLRGAEKDDHVLYASYTLWASKADFDAWTQSDQFKKSHQRAAQPGNGPMTTGHPEFEGFDVFQTTPARQAAE